MSKREAALKAAFTKELHRQCPDFVMLSFSTAGAPDRAIVGNGKTSFWEFKHGTPAFLSPGLQELLCMRLAVAGHCRYVIWSESASGSGPCTMILHPKVVHERIGWTMTPEIWCQGFDMAWLVGQVKKTHDFQR